MKTGARPLFTGCPAIARTRPLPAMESANDKPSVIARLIQIFMIFIAGCGRKKLDCITKVDY